MVFVIDVGIFRLKWLFGWVLGIGIGVVLQGYWCYGCLGVFVGVVVGSDG